LAGFVGLLPVLTACQFSLLTCIIVLQIGE